MELTIGWSIVPLVITIVAWGYGISKCEKLGNSGYCNIDFDGIICLTLSLIATLAVWLIYFIIV